MKKNLTDKELQEFWEENVGQLAYDMEEAFLNVFRQRGPEFQNPAFMIGSLSIAAGHIVQVFEKELGYKVDLKADFIDVMTKTYKHYRQHPSDEQDEESPQFPDIDVTKYN